MKSRSPWLVVSIAVLAGLVLGIVGTVGAYSAASSPAATKDASPNPEIDSALRRPYLRSSVSFTFTIRAGIFAVSGPLASPDEGVGFQGPGE